MWKYIFPLLDEQKFNATTAEGFLLVRLVRDERRAVMKSKHVLIAGLVSLACLVIGMVCGTLIERRHFNFWFPPDERAEIRATIEKARRMMAELEEIERAIEALNWEAERSITWNEMTFMPRLSDGD